MHVFRVPTRVTLAAGCLDRLLESVRDLRASSALLVHGPSIGRTRWPGRVVDLLRAGGHEVTVFEEVESNPRHTTVNRIAEVARETRAGALVGLGGGSTIDAAKAAAMLATNDGGCEVFEGLNRYERAPLPFIAVPTTCGSGSEVTWVSVINREDEGRKFSVKGNDMFPTRALVDPDLLTTLPRSLVAGTGADALTHAIEAFIGRASNPVSDALAEKAVELVFRYLPRAVDDIERDDEARFAIMRASLLAGLAFGNADVASVHCISESIGGLDPKIPHGLANAVLLPPVLRYQHAAAREDLDRLARHAGVEDGLGVISAVERLFAAIGIPGPGALGLQSDQRRRAVAKLAESNGSNASSPMPMTAANYREILDSLSEPADVGFDTGGRKG